LFLHVRYALQLSNPSAPAVNAFLAFLVHVRQAHKNPLFSAKTSARRILLGVTRFSVSRFSTSVTENRAKLNDFLAEEGRFFVRGREGTSLQLGVYALKS